MTSPASIRKVIRSRRKALSAKENRSHGESVSRHLAALAVVRKAKRVAPYLPVNGELDTAPLIEHLLHEHKRLYLPVLHPFRHGRLLFCHWDGRRGLVRNRYGIREPRCTSRTLAPSVRRLDVVIVPLVAFDASLNRIGAGLTGIVDSLYPPYTVVFAYLILGERLTAGDLFGLFDSTIALLLEVQQ